MSDWLHLSSRFFEVLTARPLSPAEQLEVAELLRAPEVDLFWGQPTHDQRHGLRAARVVLAERPERTDLARAALLHDVGKRGAGLGTLGRSLASASARLGLPVTTRGRSYLDHARLGAEQLARAGSEDLVVEFARHHHDGGRPEPIGEGDWRLLMKADS